MRKIKLEGDHVLVEQVKERVFLNDVNGKGGTSLENITECVVVESGVSEADDKPRQKYYEPGTRVLIDIQSADPFIFDKKKLLMVQSWSVIAVVEEAEEAPKLGPIKQDAPTIKEASAPWNVKAENA